MRLIKLAAVALDQTPLDWDGNRRRIVAALDAARAAGASLVCLPELCITGYGCEDAFHSAGVHALALEVLDEIIPATPGLIASIGLPLAHDGVLYNTAALVVDGRLLGFVAKQNLAGEGIHYEPRWFKPWAPGRTTMTKVLGEAHPLGDLVFDCGGVKIGFEICEDAWVASRPGRRLAQRGVDIILNPSASHFAFGKTHLRQQFVLEGARAFAATYVYANLVGNEAGRAIYDGGALIASADRLVAIGPRFSFAEMQLTTAVVDIDLTRMQRARSASYDPDEVTTSEDGLVAVDFNYPQQPPEHAQVATEAWESGEYVKHEEFARSVSLALFDYLRKSRSHGFVVSLSGGADSAAVASLVAMMVDFGVAELGREAFLARLGYIAALGKCSGQREMTHALLTCVYQSTRNSGPVTHDAAQSVAAALGAEFFDWSIDELVELYKATVAGAIGRPLDWKTDDLALQNIQARVRAPGVWLLANLRGALLLATSNRSEAAVGYTTMDGDTCGGLSPIAGIDKAFLRQWLRWLETRGPSGLAPIPALSAINAQAPTAELRPAEQHQTDEADLMPYDLLDAIERAAIRDKQTPLEVFSRMRVEFTQYSVAQLAAWVERFFRLWCRNQWKRERYAPSFHLDDENLDPKTWCRFPILSGGYERELAELRRAAKSF